MRKGKMGLQKEISRIFTGVVVPKKGDCAIGNNSAPEAPARYVPPKPTAPAPRPFTIPEPAVVKPAPVAKPVVYEPPVPAQASFPASAPEPAIQLKPGFISKPARQMPWVKIWQLVESKFLKSKPNVNSARQKAMIVIIPVLGLVFVLVLVNVFGKSGAKAKPAKKAVSSAEVFDGKINWELPPLYPETLRDPMKFGSYTPVQNRAPGQEEASTITVKGIVYSEDNPCAVVGDRIVTVGEEIEGVKVVKINPDSVEFAKGEKTWTQKVER